MRVRLILIQTRAGVQARQEEVQEGNLLSIGRHSSSGVYLPELSIALNHAKIEIVRNQVRLDLVEGDHFIVDDRLKTTPQTLQPGTVVRIGHHELRVVEPVAGEDLALEIEQVAPKGHAVEELAKRTKLGISGGFLNQRRLSWAVGVTLLVLFLVLPFAPSGSTGNFLTRSWNPGPLAPSHEYFADDCATCHVNAFRTVPDSTCLECHQSVGAHSSHGDEVHGLDERRCASCHLEHNEVRGLASVGDATCQNCHSDLASVFASTELLDVGDFARNHPQFRPSAALDQESGRRERVLPGADFPPARSGVPFAHQSHLKEPIKDARDQEVRLECGDCHRIESSGTTMLPISFQRDCQRCHSLAFDERHEDHEAPHDEVAILSASVFRFYSALALEGRTRDPEAPPAVRRRPGREISEAERLGLVAWTRKRSDDALDKLVGREGVCVECHTLREIGETTEVEPVNPVPSPEGIGWMPGAVFRHDEVHGLIADCEHCHSGVLDAEASSPLLLPQIEVCRQCHAGATPSAQRVTSPCILCHRFHQPRYGLLRAQ